MSGSRSSRASGGTRAVQVGLRELPARPSVRDDNEVLEVALVENIQRKDLTPFEEAEAMARSAIGAGILTRRSLRSSASPALSSPSPSASRDAREIKNRCRQADITSKSLLLQVVRQGDLSSKMAARI